MSSTTITCIESGANIKFPSTKVRQVSLELESANKVNHKIHHELSWRSIQVASSARKTTIKQNKNEPRFSFRSLRKSQQSIMPIDHRARYHGASNISILSEPKNIITAQSYSAFKLLGYPIIILSLAFISMIVKDQSMIESPIWQPRTRQLYGRQCVLNFFIEKYQRDEFNPDFGADQSKSEMEVDGTYYTAGQLQVITRFISSVAGTFRSKKNLHQHIIFAGVRDGGYLAEKAFQSWPRRESQPSELHIVAADTNLQNTDSLEYSYLEGVENRFKGKQDVHVYDRFGLAGQKGEENEEVDDDRLSSIMESFEDGTDNLPYPDLSAFLGKSDENNQGREEIISYMHVDGEQMEDQIEILGRAIPLFKSKSIISVGIEHSPDMDVKSLVKFFNSVGYKTFFLGSRQLARIDNLCPETLDDVLMHPIIDESKVRWSTRLLNMLNFNKDKEEMILANSYRTPPFYIALPRGRANEGEMAIQHAYDLFGGFDGEKEIKTANDRTFKK